MKDLLFATNNPHKVRELQAIVKGEYFFESLMDAGIKEDLPETRDTLEGNAIQKVEFIHNLTGRDALAEDTGLEVDALNGAPGVRTARFAGEHATADENIRLLLQKLTDTDKRTARFRTFIALIFESKLHIFEGVCEGRIAKKRMGDGGFGYDPIFIPKGYDKTFAELDAGIKNKISHRGKAVNKLIEFLSRIDTDGQFV